MIVLRDIYFSIEYQETPEKILEWISKTLNLNNKISKHILKKLLNARIYNRYLRFSEIAEDYNKKTVYYHLNKLKKIGLVSKTRNGYVLGDTLDRPFTDFIKEYYLNNVNRIVKNLEMAINLYKTKLI
jgi:predicted transcriptional regulator